MDFDSHHGLYSSFQWSVDEQEGSLFAQPVEKRTE